MSERVVMGPWRRRLRRALSAAAAERAVLVVVLVWAAIGKLSHGGPPAPAALPDWLHFTQWPGFLTGLAVLEIGTGLLLLSRRYWWHGAWAAAGLASSFAMYRLVLAYLGISSDTCGCFGSWKMSFTGAMVLLLGMLVLAFSCISRGEAIREPDPGAAGAAQHPV